MANLFPSNFSYPVLFHLWPGSGGALQTQNTANLRWGQVFKSPGAVDLTSVEVFTGSITGTTPTVKVELFAVNATTLQPTGSALASGTVTATSQALKTVSISHALSADTFYMLIVSNASASPTVDFYQISGTGTGFAMAMTSSDGGSTWSGPSGFLLAVPVFSSGGIGVFTTSNVADGGGSLTGLYNVSGSRKAYNAMLFNFPIAFDLHLIHAAGFARTGSPNYSLICEIMNGSGTVLGTSAELLLNNQATVTNGTSFLFPTPVAIPANTNVYVAFRAAGSGSVGDASNYYTMQKGGMRAGQFPSWVVTASAANKAALNSTAWASPSWSDSNNQNFIPMNLYGVPTSTGGGLILPAGMNGGFP